MRPELQRWRLPPVIRSVDGCLDRMRLVRLGCVAYTAFLVRDLIAQLAVHFRLVFAAGGVDSNAGSLGDIEYTGEETNRRSKAVV